LQHHNEERHRSMVNIMSNPLLHMYKTFYNFSTIIIFNQTID
jgi:hypothetical protein